MRVLITGGAGFIGSNLGDALLARGHAVAVLDDLSSGRRENVPDGAELFVADIRDAAAVARVFAAFRPDAVSHQAAQASVAVSVREPAEDASVNVLGSLQVLEACRRSGAGIVYASTGGAIYGEVPDGALARVGVTPAPLSPYACSKYAFELYLAAYARMHGVRTRVLRYANVYGPRQDPHGEAGVVAIFLSRLLAGEPITIHGRATLGDEGCVRDYVFVADVVRANVAALEGTLGAPILDVGTGVAVTTEALAHAMIAELRLDVTPGRTPPRTGDLGRSVLDPAAFREACGAPTPLDEGLRRTIAWYRTARTG